MANGDRKSLGKKLKTSNFGCQRVHSSEPGTVRAGIRGDHPLRWLLSRPASRFKAALEISNPRTGASACIISLEPSLGLFISLGRPACTFLTTSSLVHHGRVGTRRPPFPAGEVCRRMKSQILTYTAFSSLSAWAIEPGCGHADRMP